MKKLGFGLSRLPLVDLNDLNSIDVEEMEAMVGKFLVSGHSYFDASYVYHNGNAEKAFGELVADKFPRECYVIGTKVPVNLIREAADYDRIFEEQLERCKVDYFDYYFLQSVGKASYGSEYVSAGFEFLQKIKQEGRALKTGFLYHGDAQLLEQILNEHPETDAVQLVINYVDWKDISVFSKECYEVCKRRNVQVIALGPLKGGSLTKLPERAVALMQRCNPYASFASWGLRFAASFDKVIVVVSGMSNYEQMKDNTASLHNMHLMTEEEYSVLEQIEEILREERPVECTDCGECVKCCPEKINIPKLLALYNNQHLFKYRVGHTSAYENLIAGGGSASMCIGCCKCQQVCPENLDIAEKLRLTAAVFEKKKR